MVAQGIALLYSDTLDDDQREERLGFTMSQLVRTVGKVEIAPHVKALSFDLSCFDEDGEDVEVPYVRYLLPRV